MTEVLTSEEMRAAERRAIDSGAVTGAALMERAGAAVVAAIEAHWPDLAARAERGASPSRSPGYLHQDEGGPGVQVLCGPGNNGGDGFVVARRLRARGWTVTVFAMETSASAPDAVAARAAWDGPVLPLSREAVAQAGGTDLMVDAMFGIGLARVPDGALAALLTYLAGSDALGRPFAERLVAVDVPSGLDAESGFAPGPVVRAALTVTFDSPKPGHVLGDGPDLCGCLRVGDIGIAAFRAAGRADAPPADGPTRPRVRLVPAVESAPGLRGPGRAGPQAAFVRRDGHKFSHGHALILSGGMGRSGAARLAARGALRAGAGLVTLAAPGAALLECACQITAVMLRRCDDGADLRGLLEDRRISALCLGPGLGTARARDLVPEALEDGRPVVLDADALSAFETQTKALFDRLHPDAVLTPHMGEFARLFPDLADGMAQPGLGRVSKIAAVRLAAERAGCTVLLKGRDTVMASPSGAVSVHLAAYERAVPQLATAGAGDVLAGFITALMARGISSLSACESAAWLHVECARVFGPGLIAEDLPEMVPRVLRAALED